MQLLTTLQQKLFRWQSDGAGPIELGQRRVFILPTRGGLLFALALVVMLIGAINYNLSLGHALVFLLAGLGITAMIHTFRNLYQLRVQPGRCSAVFAGETAYFPLQLINHRSAARRALSLSTENGDSLQCMVVGAGMTEIAIPVSTTRRGWLELPRVRLSTVYPLGLFVAWSYLQPSLRCLVYPQAMASPLPAAASASSGGNAAGEEGQDDFAGFRERQPADSPRHVAWKASARDAGDRPLLLKQFAGGAARELALDWALTAAGFSVEQRLSQLAGWVLAAEAAALSYGLRLPGSEIHSGHGPAHCSRCLETLALFQP